MDFVQAFLELSLWAFEAMIWPPFLIVFVAAAISLFQAERKHCSGSVVRGPADFRLFLPPPQFRWNSMLTGDPVRVGHIVRVLGVADEESSLVCRKSGCVDGDARLNGAFYGGNGGNGELALRVPSRSG
jgi:hypothetical protein